MSEHSQEDLESSLVKLEEKLPAIISPINTFWKSTNQFQALLTEAGVPDGVKSTSSSRRFTPKDVMYLRIIYIYGDNPEKIAKNITVKIKTADTEPYTAAVYANKNYGFIWVRKFCEWFEISSTDTFKPLIKRIDIHGASPEQLTSYGKDIEATIELKKNIEDYKEAAKTQYLADQEKLTETKEARETINTEILELTEQRAKFKDQIETLTDKLIETSSKINTASIELKLLDKKSVESKNNSDQLAQQTETLNKNIANLKSELQKLTSDRNLISDEYGPYVKEGNSQAKTYSALIALPLLAIIFSTYQVYIGASNLLSAEYKTATDVLAAFILRIPFAAIFGLAIIYSWKLAYVMIQKIFKIHSDRLTLAKLLVVARETVHSSAKNLNITDHEKFQEQTALKIEVLKSHMAQDLSENFAYKPIPTQKAPLTEAPPDISTDASNDGFLTTEAKTP